jgi:hypothetical protein
VVEFEKKVRIRARLQACHTVPKSTSGFSRWGRAGQTPRLQSRATLMMLRTASLKRCPDTNRFLFCTTTFSLASFVRAAAQCNILDSALEDIFNPEQQHA